MKNDKFILNKIVEIINRDAPDSEIFLFGSRARGNSNKLSDWDLLILLGIEQLSFDIEKEFLDKFYELEIETGEIISPLIYTRNDWNKNHSFTPLFENILRDGIQLK